eukprot:TRINITY_DN7360_c0_g1_i1.p1 TRINITY_DN7360_c0_g1~~TRINITY_DN7360_c0_g1_i1.p1  ORF type:complete len:322 (-),score=54.74 TRINITY_DN7360_c0_g1_i1:47-1012(-)
MVNLWVGGLPQGVEAEEVEHFFQKCGRISSVCVRSNAKDVFAFVTFVHEDDAMLTMKEMDGVRFGRGGDPVRIKVANKQIGGNDDRNRRRSTSRQRSRSRGQRPRGDGYERGPPRNADRRPPPRNRSPSPPAHDDGFCAWLGGLPEGVTEDDVAHFVRGYGKITKIRIRSSERDVFAFVTFADAHAGMDCIRDLDQTPFGRGKKVVQMKESQSRRPEKDRENSLSRSRWSKQQADAAARYRIEIRSLPKDMQWSELKDIARDFGESVCFANTFVKSGGAAGQVMCGVVEYTEFEDAMYAYRKLNGRRIEGNRDKLEVSKNF